MNLGEINVACDTEMQHSGSEILVSLILDLEYSSLFLSHSLQMCVLFVSLFVCLLICLFVHKILIVGEHYFNFLNTF